MRKSDTYAHALRRGSMIWHAVWLVLLLFSVSKGAKHSKETVKDSIESLTLRLEHAIGSGEFTERGVASVRSLKSSTTVMSLSQSQLSLTQLEDIKAAAVAGEVYRVRTPGRLREGLAEETEEHLRDSQFVSTTISACSLISSQLSDIIKVTGDGRGNVIGLAITTLPASQTIDCTNPDVILARSFNTSITLDNGSPPPTPDVQRFVEKKEKEEREKREGKDDRSFFQKYWMYIVIGVFIVMTLNGAGQAAGGGGAS